MIKILIGGSPCTYWSVAQKKGREVEAEGLGWELFRNYLIAKEKFKPDFFLYENNKSAAPAPPPEGFDVVDQLSELLAERKKLHIIDEENLRYNCDIIALEYAIGALRR